MRIARLLVAGLAGTMVALAPLPVAQADDAAAFASADAPGTQPADLASYADLIEKCTEYDRLSSDWKWTTIYTADFRSGQPSTWHPDPMSTDHGGNRNPAAVRTSIIREDGHDELLIDGQMCNTCFLDVGPKVRGDIAVEMMCKSISPQPSDLSIVLGAFLAGPAFQFGAVGNSKALLWPGAAPNENPYAVQPFIPTGTPQTIQPNRWYHIRLEVKDGQVRGIVDGHEIGKVALNPNFALGDDRQPFLYCYNSQMVVRELHIEAYGHDPKSVDPNAWSKVFGAEEPAAIQNQLDGLVRFLADSDPAVRDKAGEILTGLGEPVIPALQRAAASNVPELTLRAKSILRTLIASGRAPITNRKE